MRKVFKQPNVLYQHLHSSFHQLVEEIIPTNIGKDNNYFYESTGQYGQSSIRKIEISPKI